MLRRRRNRPIVRKWLENLKTIAALNSVARPLPSDWRPLNLR